MAETPAGMSEFDRLLALLRAEMADLIDAADAQPEREPDTIEAMLGIDPNDPLNILAAQAVRARFQRDDALRSLQRAERTITAVTQAMLTHRDDLDAMADAVDDALSGLPAVPDCDGCTATDRPLRFSPEHGAHFCPGCFAINNPTEPSWPSAHRPS